MLPTQEIPATARTHVQGLAVSKGVGLPPQAMGSQRPGTMPVQMPPGQVTSVLSMNAQCLVSNAQNLVVQGQQASNPAVPHAVEVGKASLMLGASHLIQSQVFSSQLVLLCVTCATVASQTCVLAVAHIHIWLSVYFFVLT